MRYVTAILVGAFANTTFAQDFSAEQSERFKQHTERVVALHSEYKSCLQSNGVSKAKSACGDKRNRFINEYPPELGKLVVSCVEESEFGATPTKDEGCAALRAFGKRVKAQGGRWE